MPRKPNHYVDSAGRQHHGLTRQKDGRWRVIGTTKPYSAPDEATALARFYATKRAALPPGWQTVAAAAAADDLRIEARNKRLWAFVASEIRARPQWVAEQTGIEQIGYLTSLTPPEPAPTFLSLIEAYEQYGTAGKQEKSLVKKSVLTFLDFSKAKTTADVTKEMVVAYRDYIHSRGYAPKHQQHLFNRLRGVLRFAAYKRAIATKRITETLDLLKLLYPSSRGTVAAPIAITPTDFHSLLKAADATDRAMLLLMLNAALYLGEVARAKWEEIKDGCFVSRRKKTGQEIRVAPLWPITVAAIDAIKNNTEYILLTKLGTHLTTSGAEKRWRKLRTAAKLPTTLKASHIRDGALTAATAGGTPSTLIDILAGHRQGGMKDKYIQRSPMMVKPATDAVYDYYFAKPHQTAPEASDGSTPT